MERKLELWISIGMNLSSLASTGNLVLDPSLQRTQNCGAFTVFFPETDDSSIDIIVSSLEQLGDPSRLLFPIFVSFCCIVPTIFAGRRVDSGNWGPVEAELWFKRCCRTGVSRWIFSPWVSLNPWEEWFGVWLISWGSLEGRGLLNNFPAIRLSRRNS